MFERFKCPVCKAAIWADEGKTPPNCRTLFGEGSQDMCAVVQAAGYVLADLDRPGPGRMRCPGQGEPDPLPVIPTGKRVTDWREHSEPGDYKYRTRISYGFDIDFARRTAQEPCFFITYETERRNRNGGGWREDSGGCGEDPIREHFPELADLLPWHLCDIGKGPMHYVENSLYHAGLTQFPDALNIDYFKSTAVFGHAGAWDEGKGAELLAEIEKREATAEEVRSWLLARLPALMRTFHMVMEAHGLIERRG